MSTETPNPTAGAYVAWLMEQYGLDLNDAEDIAALRRHLGRVKRRLL